ncbi:MAG TPA: F0F1 ATP synthase subunit B, partial [Gammaproteobacteria bacterium]|nr:F0F1 ATP synthase subunit B [Gammaproteobacteria bacterium]
MNVTATLIGQIIVFAVLVWFVKKVLWGPMLNMMEERKKRIADGLAAAERGEQEKEEAEQRVKEQLDKAKQHASEIINQAQRRAGEVVDEAKTEAHEEGERIKAAAQSDIEQEINRAREGLRKQVAAIAIAGA